MKKKSYLFLLVLVSLFFSNCTDDIDKIKNTLTIAVTTPQINSFVHFEFIDAKTGKYITEKDVTLKVTGTNAGQIYSTLGENKDSYKSLKGMLDLIVDPKFDMSGLAEKPLEFIVEGSCAGYTPYVSKVRVHENKNIMIQVPMVNLTNLPEGVTWNKKNITTGTTGATQKVETVTLDGGKSIIEIPKGVILKDAEGKVVKGTVKTEMLFYNPTHEAALESFPGGLSVEAVKPDGSTADVTFTSAGLFDINLTAGTQVVKTLEGGVKMTTKLDPTMINPKTGVAIKEGDEIEMWSMDKETMIWKYEKTAKIKNENGELYLQENINHLSYWNWDWFTNSCTYGAKIEWVGNAPMSTVTIKNKYPFNRYSESIRTYVDTKSNYYNFLQFLYVPSFPATLEFSSLNSNVKFEPAKLIIPNMCDNKTYTVKVMDTRTFYNINLDMTMTAKSNHQKEIKANAFFYIKPKDAYYWGYAQMTNGILKTSVNVDTEYIIAGYYDRSWGEGTIKVEDVGEQLKITFTPSFLYNDVSGSTSVDPEGNEVRVEFLKKPSNSNTIDVKMLLILTDKVANKLGI